MDDLIIAAVSSESVGDSGVQPPKDQKLEREKLTVRRREVATLVPSDKAVPAAGNPEPQPVNLTILGASDKALPVSVNPEEKKQSDPLSQSGDNQLCVTNRSAETIPSNNQIDLSDKTSSKSIQSDDVTLVRGENYRKPYSQNENDAIKSFVEANIDKPWNEVRLTQLYDDKRLGGRYTKHLRAKALEVYLLRREALGLGYKDPLGVGQKEALGAGIGGSSSNVNILNIGFGDFEKLLEESAARGAMRALESNKASAEVDLIQALESDRGKTSIKACVSEVLTELKTQKFVVFDDTNEEGDNNGKDVHVDNEENIE